MDPQQVKETSLLAINLYEIAFQMINFGILYYLLKKFLAKPLSNILTDRATTIKHNLEKADVDRRRADEMLKEQADVLKSAQLDAQAIRKKAEESAEKELATIIDEGRASAKKMVEQAKAEIDVQVNSAQTKLLKDTADLAISVINKFVVTEMSDQEKKTSIDRLIAKVSNK